MSEKAVEELAGQMLEQGGSVGGFLPFMSHAKEF